MSILSPRRCREQIMTRNWHCERKETPGTGFCSRELEQKSPRASWVNSPENADRAPTNAPPRSRLSTPSDFRRHAGVVTPEKTMEPLPLKPVYVRGSRPGGLAGMKDGVLRWRHGPSFEDDGICFRLWAPRQEQIALMLDGRDPIAMRRNEDGFHETLVNGLPAGARYRFALASGQRVPDPASRFQPDDVNGPSEAIDPARLSLARILERPRMARHRSLRTPPGRFFP